MTVLRITNGFDKMSDPDLELKARSILNAMTSNSSFPTSTPTLATVQAAINDYSDALAIAQTGSVYDKALKNQKKEALVVLLHNLANYVLFTAAGNELIARSSGFTIAKSERTPAPAVVPARGQVLSDGPNPGDLDYNFKRVPGATGYVYQLTLDPITENSVWESKAGTVRKVRFTGLPRGQRVWCRVMTIGRRGQAVYSEPVSRIVQ